MFFLNPIRQQEHHFLVVFLNIFIIYKEHKFLNMDFCYSG